MTGKAVFVCYEKCTTYRKARKWLDEHDIPYDIRPIKEENPSAEELRGWQKTSGLPLKRFYNTSGQLYRSMELKDRIPAMSDEEQISLLATDGMLVKRPILITGDGKTVLVGFKEEEWNVLLK